MVASLGSNHAVADDLSSDPIMRRGPYAAGTDMAQRRGSSQVRRAPSSSGLYDVLDLILDKGIVIDAFVRVSLVGIELLTIDLRVVIASVDTYLRYAEGVERLNIRGDERSEPGSLPGMFSKGMKARAVSKGAEQVGRVFGGDSDDDDDAEAGHDGGQGVTGVLTKGVKSVVGRLLGGDEGDDDNARKNDDDRGRQPEQRRRLPGREGREGERRAPARSGGSAGTRR